MFCQFASYLQTLTSPLSLHDALVLPASSRVARRCVVHRIFAGQNPSSEGTIRRHSKSVVGAGRQMLYFGHAVQQVVAGLTHHWAIDAGPIAEPRNLSHPPCAEIRDAEIPD